MLIFVGAHRLGICIIWQFDHTTITGPKPVPFEAPDGGSFIKLLNQQREKVFKELDFEFSSSFDKGYFGRRSKGKGIKVLIKLYLQAFFKSERISKKVVEKSSLRFREKSCARIVQGEGLKEVFCRNPFSSLKIERWKLVIGVRFKCTLSVKLALFFLS